MALGPAFDLVLSLVAMTDVERRGLKTMGRENNPAAPATRGLRLGRSEQCGSQTSPAVLFADPEVGDLTVTAPRVAIEARDDFSTFIANAGSEQFAVEVAGRFGVELV